MYRPAILGLLLSCLLIGIAQTEAAEPKRPNIVFIFSDDHAFQAISAYGSKINRTPQIDRLAREEAERKQRDEAERRKDDPADPGEPERAARGRIDALEFLLSAIIRFAPEAALVP